MAIHDYDIENASGAAFRLNLNNALAAIRSNNSADDLTDFVTYQWWVDESTDPDQLKIRGTSDWIPLLNLDDGTRLLPDGTAAAPSLTFVDDVDTGLFRSAANTLGIATSGVERVEFGVLEVVFNDSGANVDFRVEGDSEANLLFVDAGNDHVGIAEGSPGTVLEIGSTEPYVTLKNSTEEDTDGGRESRLIFEGEQSGGEISTLAQVEVSHDGTADDQKGKLVISTNDGDDGASPTARLTVESTGNVTIEDGDLVVASGHGIDFSGTADGSGTTSSELLDDYEEGTWTPVFQGATTAGTYTYSTQQGSYTKIGRQVTATFALDDITTSSVGSGNLQITGLPFANSSTFASVGSVEGARFDVADASVNLCLKVAASNSHLTIQETKDNSSLTTVQVTDKKANTAELRGTITYFTD